MTVPTDRFYARVEFRDFIRHFRKLDDAAIVADVQQSMDDIDNLNDEGSSFGSLMVKWSLARKERYPKAVENGRKGGRPRKQKELDALVSRPKSLPGTSSGNGEALNDEGATAPAGQSFEARQAAPGAQLESASGQPSTPAPVSAHGNAAEGGLLTPWYGPGTGETFDGDAATREGAVDNLTPQGEASESAPSPSDFQKRPGKSATGKSSRTQSEGGSERGAGGTAIEAVRRSPGAKVPEPRLRYGSAGNVLMTATEAGKLASEFGDVRQITEELSDYLLLHPNKYRSHYAALRNWCRRRIRDGLNPDGTRMTQGDRLARHFAMREKEILDGNEAEKE